MIARAGKLCGLDTEMTPAAVRDILAAFSDYVTVAAWARPGIAVCFDHDLMDDSVLEIQPAEVIQRCEIAEMLFRLLGKANLL